MKAKIRYVFFSLFFCVNIINGQCAMCRAVLESEEGLTAAKGINDGIVYLMAIPYVLVGGIGYIVYRKYIKPKK